MKQNNRGLWSIRFWAGSLAGLIIFLCAVYFAYAEDTNLSKAKAPDVKPAPTIRAALVSLEVNKLLGEENQEKSTEEPAKLVSEEHLVKTSEFKIIKRRPAAAKKAGERLKKKTFTLPDPDPADEKMLGYIKRLEGVVSGKSNYGMAVEYGVDPVTKVPGEMWVNYTKAVKFQGVKDFSEFQEGDKVSVVYKEDDDKSKRVLQEVRLTAKKPKEEPAAADKEEAAGESADVTTPAPPKSEAKI